MLFRVLKAYSLHDLEVRARAKRSQPGRPACGLQARAHDLQLTDAAHVSPGGCLGCAACLLAPDVAWEPCGRRAEAGHCRVQTGYCQGMAFVAGVLLMFVPEEPAWQLLCQLMAEDAGGMRGLFVPGLAGLKRALRMFEWLLDRSLPQLKRHLEVRQQPLPAPPVWGRAAPHMQLVGPRHSSQPAKPKPGAHAAAQLCALQLAPAPGLLLLLMPPQQWPGLATSNSPQLPGCGR